MRRRARGKHSWTGLYWTPPPRPLSRVQRRTRSKTGPVQDRITSRRKFESRPLPPCPSGIFPREKKRGSSSSSFFWNSDENVSGGVTRAGARCRDVLIFESRCASNDSSRAYTRVYVNFQSRGLSAFILCGKRVKVCAFASAHYLRTDPLWRSRATLDLYTVRQKKGREKKKMGIERLAAEGAFNAFNENN